MKIMVTGIGGVGGYMASFLCAYHDHVTIIARGKRKESILEKGLVLHSDNFGERVSHPAVTDDPSTCGIQDVIFICVKNYSLPAALTAVLPCISDETIVVFMQNGVDHTEVARSIMTKGKIMDSTLYINSEAEPDYSIRQFGAFARMYISGSEGKYSEVLHTVLDHPGLKIRFAKDIRVEVWNKFITNCAINVLTAYYEASIGGALAQPEGTTQFHQLLSEAAAVGKAEGVNLSDTLVEEIYNRVMGQQNKESTSSLARDIMARRPSELEVFSGYLVREADKLHVDVPMSRYFYGELLKRTQA